MGCHCLLQRSGLRDANTAGYNFFFFNKVVKDVKIIKVTDVMHYCENGESDF